LEAVDQSKDFAFGPYLLDNLDVFERLEVPMPTYSARLSSKGQFVMPVEVREALGLKGGDRIEFFLSRSGRLSLFRSNAPASGIFGLGAGQPGLSEDDRMKSVADEITSRGRSRMGERAA